MSTCSVIMPNPDGESLLKWFLDHGAPANGLPSDPGAPLRYAPTAAMASLLLSHGAVLKHTSALHAAVSRDNDAEVLPLMKVLLDNGIDIDELKYEGRDKLPRGASRRDHGTALQVAAVEGSVERARTLVERGADLMKVSKDGYTARDYAQLYKKEEVKIYLESVMKQRGIEVREVDEEDLEYEYEDDYELRGGLGGLL